MCVYATLWVEFEWMFVNNVLGRRGGRVASVWLKGLRLSDMPWRKLTLFAIGVLCIQLCVMCTLYSSSMLVVSRFSLCWLPKGILWL